MNETQTLRDLVLKAKDSGLSFRQMEEKVAAAEAREPRGLRLNRTTASKIARGIHGGDAEDGTIRAIALVAGVPDHVAFTAAGRRTNGPPFADELPAGVDDLEPNERRVALDILRVLVAQRRELNRHAHPADRPASRPAHPSTPPRTPGTENQKTGAELRHRKNADGTTTVEYDHGTAEHRKALAHVMDWADVATASAALIRNLAILQRQVLPASIASIIAYASTTLQGASDLVESGMIEQVRGDSGPPTVEDKELESALTDITRASGVLAAAPQLLAIATSPDEPDREIVVVIGNGWPALIAAVDAVTHSFNELPVAAESEIDRLISEITEGRMLIDTNVGIGKAQSTPNRPGLTTDQPGHSQSDYDLVARTRRHGLPAGDPDAYDTPDLPPDPDGPEDGA